MPWHPETYNQFKDIRYQPFYDLAALIQPAEKMKAVDLGCGTGEQTSILVQKFPTANFIGIDSSAEMLEKSKQLENDRLQLKIGTTETVVQSGEKWDLIFSNAALQWSDNHAVLFPELIGLLHPGGQFAVQMPYQPENILNQILFKQVEEEPFATQLRGWRRSSPVLTLDAYAQILFNSGLQDMQIFQKVYPIIAQDHETLFKFISGSALIPYMERLQPIEQEVFIREFKMKIAEAFPVLPAVYAFKRVLLYGRKPG